MAKDSKTNGVSPAPCSGQEVEIEIEGLRRQLDLAQKQITSQNEEIFRLNDSVTGLEVTARYLAKMVQLPNLLTRNFPNAPVAGPSPTTTLPLPPVNGTKQ